MIPILFALAAAIQQPQPAGQQPRSPSSASQAPGAPQATNPALDSTIAAITGIGTKVAEMRSVYDLYRRAAFNEPDGVLLERAQMYGASCRDLADAAQHGHRIICRDCVARRLQVTVDQFRTYLPSLERLARSCASRMDTLKGRGSPAAQVAALRAEVRPAGSRMVQGLRVYETRLKSVRSGFGWDTPQVPTPRRGE